MDKNQEGARILIKLVDVKNATILLPTKKGPFIEAMEPFANIFGQNVWDCFSEIEMETRDDIVDPYIIIGGQILLLEDFLK